jgi:hypothetical protein
MKMDTTISLKEILTLLSIAVSVIALYFSWRKDRQLKIKTKADEIRSYASFTLEGIERWKEISKSLFYKCDVIFVETSELIKTSKVVPFAEIERARDFLWKNLMRIIAENNDSILEEKINTSYFKLYSYFPEIEHKFQLTLSALKETEFDMINEFVVDMTQNSVMNINSMITDKYHSAMLGNELRKIRNQCLIEYLKKLEEQTLGIKTILTDLMKRKDNDLIKQKLKLVN